MAENNLVNIERKTKMDNNREYAIKLQMNMVLTVDSNEWYYGQKKNFNNREKKLLVTSCVPSDATKMETYSKEINEHFIWMQSHERDTLKKKKRLFYVDRDLFKNQDFRFS